MQNINIVKHFYKGSLRGKVWKFPAHNKANCNFSCHNSAFFPWQLHV